MFSFFEKLVNPYPDTAVCTPPKGFWAFIWQATEGTRGYIVAMTLCSVLFGAFEALLFAMLGKMVDWLSKIEPANLLAQEGTTLLFLAGIIASSIFVVALQTMLKHQSLAGNFPMRLRWNFHRMMLNQSMSFFQDEFAGRIATKVMQTALAVRDTCLILTDILVYMFIYYCWFIF